MNSQKSKDYRNFIECQEASRTTACIRYNRANEVVLNKESEGDHLREVQVSNGSSGNQVESNQKLLPSGTVLWMKQIILLHLLRTERRANFKLHLTATYETAP